MKVEGWLFTVIAVFLIPVTVVYWYASEDPTGTTALILTFGLCFLIAFYLLYTARRITPRPEDDPAANIEDAAGDLGFFSPYSWWPLAVAAACAVMFLGIVFGWWLFILALPFVALTVMGFVFEYYRGEHEH
ncbi:MAG TPA: cytochrome c oxidase subunit 4 [Actinomycetes bacterium]|nr:cytochrome c oxidase subunit 4 [Actinomycetes bacterium]